MIEVSSYYMKFDDNGKSTGNYAVGVNMSAEDIPSKLADGYIEVSAEDYMYYVGNRGNGDNNTGYIRDKSTGKPVSAPVHVKTKEELATDYYNTYNSQVTEINNNIVLASANGDTALVTELKAEKETILSEYKAKLEALQ
jgi:hypothetical protein